MSWSAGAGDGALSLSRDGVEEASLAGPTHFARRVDSVQWGVVGGSLDGAGGTPDIDAFRSRP